MLFRIWHHPRPHYVTVVVPQRGRHAEFPIKSEMCLTIKIACRSSVSIGFMACRFHRDDDMILRCPTTPTLPPSSAGPSCQANSERTNRYDSESPPMKCGSSSSLGDCADIHHEVHGHSRDSKCCPAASSQRLASILQTQQPFWKHSGK